MMSRFFRSKALGDFYKPRRGMSASKDEVIREKVPYVLPETSAERYFRRAVVGLSLGYLFFTFGSLNYDSARRKREADAKWSAKLQKMLKQVEETNEGLVTTRYREVSPEYRAFLQDLQKLLQLMVEEHAPPARLEWTDTLKNLRKWWSEG